MGNVFHSVEASDLDSLDNLVRKIFSTKMDFLFRGHADSEWSLDTTLDRLFRRIKPIGIDLDSTEDYVLNMFIKVLRGRTAISKDIKNNRNEIWVLGQHYGLATPLLDWTESFYVALFFACNDPTPPKCGFRTVWALHKNGIMDAMQKYNSTAAINNKFEFVDILTDHNPRLTSQSGILTRQPLGFNIKDWLCEKLPNEENPHLIEIKFPDSIRINALKHLRLMGIHNSSLFPDVGGAARYCNDTLELMADIRKMT